MNWLEHAEGIISATRAYAESLEDTLKGKSIEAFKKHCPCWSRFEVDRKCDECAYLKDFINAIEES